MALHAIIDHPDYITMSKQARAFLWDFTRQYNGHNNGNLAAAEGTMGKWGWSRRELERARLEVEAKGWIARTRHPPRKRDPVLYRITWVPLDEWEGKPKLDPDLIKGARPRSLR